MKVVDIFSGVGGLSLGATRAGLDLIGAVEVDKINVDSHALNFTKAKHVHCDVREISGNDVLTCCGVDREEVVGVIGGPPCQGFSTIGRRELNDPRNSLFSHFFRLVWEIQPEFFLAENVPGILNKKFSDLVNGPLSIVRKRYNVVDPFLVAASNCGVPTRRERVFFVGFHKRTGICAKAFHVEYPRYAHCVRDALSGLSRKIDPDWKNNNQEWTDLEYVSQYSDFLSKVVPSGVGYLPALDKYFQEGKVTGCTGTKHSQAMIERYAMLGAGERDMPSRSVRLNSEGLCPTLRAGTGPEHGSFQAVRPIHPTEPRVITPREAARLQGFPDWFVFHRTKWHSFRQIGNSVSPVVAELILSHVKRIILKR